jgi:hypothetical protein
VGKTGDECRIINLPGDAVLRTTMEVCALWAIFFTHHCAWQLSVKKCCLANKLVLKFQMPSHFSHLPAYLAVPDHFLWVYIT